MMANLGQEPYFSDAESNPVEIYAVLTKLWPKM